MKFKKLLPLAVAFALCSTSAFAASEKAQTDYTLDVADFFNVTYLATNASSTINADDSYTTATLAGDITGTYTVITNHSEDIFLYGSCKASDGNAHAMFGTPGALKLVFTNQNPEEEGHLATKTQIAEMQTGTDATKSPNAIAFNLKVTPKLIAGTFPEGKAITPGAALETNVLKYDVPNCNATFTCQITGASVDNSFSTLDQTGTYKATLYLSNTTAGAL